MSWTLPKILPTDYATIEVIDLRPKIPINPKGGWDDINPPRDVQKLTTIILHHDGMSKTSTSKYSDEQLIINIAKSHINSTKNRKNGDGSFPYHLYVRSGKVYICNNLSAFTYGVASNNSYTVHISIGGNYSSVDAMTDADRNALALACLLAKGSMPAYKETKGHKELQATSCPGFNVKDIVDVVTGLELQIEQSQSAEKKAELAYRMANQTLYLYNMFYNGKKSNGEEATAGERNWALNQVLLLEPEYRRLGFLK